ncbi:MAG TPA: hypothetical protein VGO09_07685, partial [Flavisolibacter sp.]|nr:hypothetical protein [Flavisolibacter sp.]
EGALLLLERPKERGSEERGSDERGSDERGLNDLGELPERGASNERPLPLLSPPSRRSLCLCAATGTLAINNIATKGKSRFLAVLIDNLFNVL